MVASDNIHTAAPEAVIFDFDGVIVDTEPLHYHAFQQVLKPEGMHFSWEEYVATYMGFDDRDAFREAYRSRERLLKQDELAFLVDAKAAVFIEVIKKGVKEYPGVIELIRKFQENGLPMAISSGALRSDIMPILSQLGISDCFSIIVAADDVSRSKPDPESYLMAYTRLCMSFPTLSGIASRSVAIEDTPAGIAAAKAAGLKVLAVANSYPRECLTAADAIVDSLLDAPSCLVSLW